MGVSAKRQGNKVRVWLPPGLGLRVAPLAAERDMDMDQAASQLVELGMVLLAYPDKFPELAREKGKCFMCGRSSTVERQHLTATSG